MLVTKHGHTRAQKTTSSSAEHNDDLPASAFTSLVLVRVLSYCAMETVLRNTATDSFPMMHNVSLYEGEITDCLILDCRHNLLHHVRTFPSDYI